MPWPWNRNKELNEEIEAHLNMAVQDRVAQGASEQEALASARREFGNVGLVKEVTRDIWGWRFAESFFSDISYAFRQLRKGPIVTAVAVLSLALGIGANTAIFTLINAIMLQWLPVRDPGQLVLFNNGTFTGTYSGNTPRGDVFSYPFWQYLKTHDDSFQELCAFRQGPDLVLMHLAGAAATGPQEQVDVHLVSGDYFDVLGVTAAAGRVLRPEDDTRNAPPVAVISYNYWRDRFHLNEAAIGKTVVLNGTAVTIVGVAAREFFGERVEARPDYWIPLSFQPEILQRESWLEAQDQYWLNFMGRLKPGQTIRSADAAIDIRLHQFYTELAGTHLSPSLRRQIQRVHVDLKPGGGGISGLRFRYSQPLHILMAVVGLVLLIACANLAILLLARTSARRQEFLARVALGASRTRLIRQILTESVLLSLTGGVLGAVFAYWCVKGLILLLHIGSVVRVRPDLPVLAFTIAVSVLTGIAFGIIPAIKYSGLEPRATTAVRPAEFGNSRFGSAQTLIVLQVALSLVLLLGAGLLAHSLVALETQNVGFAEDHVLLVRTDPRLADYQPKNLFLLYRQIDERLNALPGVVSATVARYTPESGHVSIDDLSIQGCTPPPDKKMHVSDLEIAPRYFQTLGTPLLRGRSIGPRDTPATPPVAVVNETFVREYLPHEDPIGQRFSLGSSFHAPGVEIVGVVADSKYYGLGNKPEPMAFFSLWQGQPARAWAIYAGDLIILTKGRPADMIAEVKQALADIDMKLPILQVTTLSHQIDETLQQQKMITGLCSAFGILALVLAAVGIYGTVAYAVARRTTEIGIRMALGAQRANVLWMVLRDAVILIAAGIVLGLPLAMMGARWIRGFLFGIPAADPVAIGSSVVLIGSLALLAGYLPARRAAKIDPLSAIRYE